MVDYDSMRGSATQPAGPTMGSAAYPVAMGTATGPTMDSGTGPTMAGSAVMEPAPAGSGTGPTMGSAT